MEFSITFLETGTDEEPIDKEGQWLKGPPSIGHVHPVKTVFRKVGLPSPSFLLAYEAPVWFPFLPWKCTHAFLKFHAHTEAHIPPFLPLIIARVEQGAPNRFETPQAWSHATCLSDFKELMLRNIPGSQDRGH